MNRIVMGIAAAVLLLLIAVGGRTAAQEGSTSKPSAAAKGAEPIAVDQNERAVVQQLGQRAQGLIDARAVLQKELDAVVADYSRAVQAIAAKAPAGTVLDPQTMTYVKKPDDPKKDVTPPK